MLFTIEKVKISRPSDIIPILNEQLANADETDKMKEHFWCIGLNGANMTIYCELVSLGLINQCPVHPREVFRHAISESACAIIIGHNHPSGLSEASREDNEVTQRIKVSGDILGIQLLDHVILGESSYYSFAENGLV